MEFKRIDGSRAKIICELTLSYASDIPNYKIQVWFCPSNRRKFTFVDITNNYQYRIFEFNSPERKLMELDENLKYVTAEEMLLVKNKLWQLLKPQP